MLESETNSQPLSSAIFALGNSENPLAIPWILKFVDHAESDIRYATACSLGQFAFENGPLCVEALLKLMEDSDEHVRDWATFGLGTLSESNSEKIRAAFLRRLNDSHSDTRAEAMVGLARRKDQRVLPALLAALQKTETFELEIETAYLMLGMEEEREDWAGADYAAALRKRFSG